MGKIKYFLRYVGRFILRHADKLLLAVIILSLFALVHSNLPKNDECYWLKILSETNYYKLNCRKPAIEIDMDTFIKCQKLDKIINKDSVSFHWPVECDYFDPNLILALKQVESAHNPNAIGDQGRSFGLMQIQYTTAKGLGFEGKPRDLLDPYTNMKWGCTYLSKMYERTGGDILQTLRAYNMGPRALKIPYNGDWENHSYVSKILLAKKQKIKKEEGAKVGLNLNFYTNYVDI